MNLNSSCIEIMTLMNPADDLDLMNLNSSCIEILFTYRCYVVNHAMNLNSSCIEIHAIHPFRRVPCLDEP